MVRATERAAGTTELVAAERSAIETELAEIDAAVERYLASFERGTMPEELCAPRVRALNDRAATLKARHADLVAQCEEATLVAPEPEVLTEVRQELVEAMASGSRPQVKALLAALVHEVRWKARTPCGRSSRSEPARRRLHRRRFVDRPGWWALQDSNL